MENWHSDYQMVLAVGEYLVYKGIYAQELLYFFHKPWKYSEDYKEAIKEGFIDD